GGIMHHNQLLKSALGVSLVGLLATGALAQFNETEANDNKTQANSIVTSASGYTISGNTTGTSTTVAGAASADHFLITMYQAAPAIYRHRLTLSSQTVGHSGAILGLTQTAGTPNAGTYTAFQTSSTATTPARFNQWYGFGKSEQLYYRVTGGTATTANYTATHSVDVITPTAMGNFQAGSISISAIGQGHSTDTDMWVYDSNFNAISGYGNDDGGTTGLQSQLTRTYAPGKYYLAISNFGIANNLGSPADDRFRTGSVMDFPNILVNSSTTTNLNLTFTIASSDRTFQQAATKVGPYDVNFYEFNVVPEPGTMAALGLGVFGAIARRRRSKK
ncbi:MAG TPA: PEP-CTERM sorting domain-containing protein, partial [Fimbriimonadaceae bacterium]|nr:PEP-CTERM sorting domain-containing protein [Fimbriimonadaceae bacterium]